MKKEFNQAEYIKEYRKKHYSTFNVDMIKEDREKLKKLISENGFSSSREFLEKCIEIMESENNPIKKEPND